MTLPQPKPGILDIQPYKGGEGRVPGVHRLVRLASNENVLGCSPAAKAAYLKAADDLHRYPDGAAQALREAIGKGYNMNPERIVCGAGSDELISLLIRAYVSAGDDIVYSQYGFLMYPIGAKAVGVLVESGPRADGRLWLAIGIGVNLAHAPTDVDRPATAFAEHMAAPPPSPAEALEVLASRFEFWRAQWATHGFAPIARAWTARAHGLGGRCEARLPNRTVEGLAEGLDPDGALRLRLDDGAIERITAGDVFFGAA